MMIAMTSQPLQQEPKRAWPIPVTILSGFLGAGKTTLLNRILAGEHGLRVAAMVNDFGAINIDAQLIVGIDDSGVINLTNGCICCTLREDLLKETLRLIHREPSPEYILVEASGVADPMPIIQTFTLPDVNPYLYLDSVVTVVDAEQFSHLQGDNADLAYAQLAVADLIILSKTDLVGAEELQRLKETLLPPEKPVFFSTYGDVPLSYILGVGAYDVSRYAKVQNNSYHGDHHQMFSTWSWLSAGPLEGKAIKRLLRDLPHGLLRMKGILNLAEVPARKTILQVVGHRYTITSSDSWGMARPHSQVVAIGLPGSLEADTLSQRFEACKVE